MNKTKQEAVPSEETAGERRARRAGIIVQTFILAALLGATLVRALVHSEAAITFRYQGF